MTHIANEHLIIFADFSLNNVEHLDIPSYCHVNCSEYNKAVDNLPQKLNCLMFGFEFNQLVNHLPSELTHSFNQELNLNNSVKYLELNCLPTSLIEL